jgi:hypothetical protein
VRGIVASRLGRRYLGIDLRLEQVTANKEQAARICSNPEPIWLTGDSRYLQDLVHDYPADFLFSSPPYYWREHYSELQEDLNNSASYAEFLDSYRHIIAAAVSYLGKDRFACFEVAEIRTPSGICGDFIGETIKAFGMAGASLYNHLIHLKPLASAAIRATGMFEAARKLVPVHEHVLVFVKGDPIKATAAIGPVEVADVFSDNEVSQ